MATILVVEDERPIREVLQTFLDRKGYTVLVAGSGEDALQRCHTFQDDIDVMIVDLNLPGMDGIQLTTHMKASRPRMRVVFFSAGVKRKELIEKEILPADAVFIEKPFVLSAIESTICTMLESNRH